MADRGIARHWNPRTGALSRLAALVPVLLLILAACGPTAGSPVASATATPTPTPAATAEVTASPAATASPDATPEAPGPTDLDDEFAATDFKVIGMSATLDDTGDVPNASTFQSVFPAMSERIYVLYELDDGAAETVNFSWAQGGRELFTNSFDYKTTTTFAWGWITPPSSGRFATGDYSVTLSLEESGDTITVPFSVE